MSGVKRLAVLLSAAVGLGLGLEGAAFATATFSAAVNYWGPTPISGSQWCGKVVAGVDDEGSGSASSGSLAYYGSNCLNIHNVPAGYLGAQVHLVRSDGTLCGSTAWAFNGTSASFMTSVKNLNPSGSCPASGTYRGSAHAEHWNPNTNWYVKSDWVNSPYLPF